jgi:hypothetical protein
MQEGSPGEDHSHNIADVHFEIERTRLLGTALNKARFGELAADWRSALIPPVRPRGTSTLYTDSDRLAVEAIRMMEPAKWEPGNAGDWRSALESWYIDSLAVVDDSANATCRSTSLMRAGAKRAREAVGSRAALADELKQQPNSLTFTTVDSMDSSIDGLIRTYELVRRRARDRIKAQYRAGLVAGGDQLEVDWLEWLANKIRSWPNDEAVKKGLAAINKPNFREQMEYLPSYWL